MMMLEYHYNKLIIIAVTSYNDTTENYNNCKFMGASYDR